MNLELFNQINEAYRTGEILELRVEGVLDTELVKDIHELYVSGFLHLPKYCQVFGYSRAKNLKDIFKKIGLKTLTIKQTYEIYGSDIESIKKETNLERYGVSNPTQSSEIQEKTRKTNLERYGVSNPAQSSEIQEKTRKTNLERYGSISPFGSPEIQEKAKKSFIKNNGYENPSISPEIRKKIEQTNLERYGSVSPLGSPEIRKKIEQTNLERYGSVSPLGSPEISDKAKMTCKVNFGHEYPLQSQVIKEKVKKTNLERYGSTSPLGSPEIQEKVKKTNLERYGHENPFGSPGIREDIRRTNLERYGSTSPFQSPEIQEKIKQTNLERYGCENPFQSPEIQEKIKQTNLERYGCENPCQNLTVREKMNKTNLERYGFEHIFQSPEIQEKIKQTNLERYGFEHIFQSPEIQEKIKSTNLERYGSTSPLGSPEIQEKIKSTNLERYGSISPLGSPEIREKSKSTRKSNDRRYATLEELAENDQNKATQFILENYTNQSKVLKRYGLYQKNLSSIEIAIREILDRHKIEYLFHHRPKFLEGKELDFFIPNRRAPNNPVSGKPGKPVAIEVNGLYWHSYPKKDKYYHQDKHLRCRSEGIQLLSFTEDQILEKLEIIESMILHKLGLTPYRVYAKNCTIRELRTPEAKDFLEKNHLHGFSNASTYLGLEYNGKLVHVMSFGNNRFKKSDHPELIRSASLRFHSVAGGFQRLLKYYKKTYKVDLVESYVDFNISNGQSYELASKDLEDLGNSSVRETVRETKRDNLTEPDLWFVFRGKRYRRQMFMKHNLHKIFEDFPKRSDDGYENITVREYLKDRGVLEYYGAGNLKYLI